MNPGDTFLLPDAFGTHLYIVLAKLDDGTVVFCHCTTSKKHTDNTCIIRPGEHEFAIRDTAVQYASAFDCSGDGLEKLVKSIIKPLPPLSAELLARVRKGALESSQTSDKIKTLLL
jgi:hypothetical protein